MARYKIVFTDYYYPNNNMEVKILKQLGDVEIVDCTKIEKSGIKEEDKIIEYAKDAVADYPDFNLIVGAEAIFIAAFESGATGSVCGMANAFPK